MEALEAIKTRRIAPEFSGKKISKEIKYSSLNAGVLLSKSADRGMSNPRPQRPRYAADFVIIEKMNNQPRRFIVFSDKNKGPSRKTAMD